jgi:hypothetical protein
MAASAVTRVRTAAWTVPWLDVAVAAGLAAIFVPFSLLRYVDGDEGPYLAAAKLVMGGELPYRDFLYTQTPLLPYVWGPWSVVTGESWYAARVLAALFAVGIGWLVFRHVSSRFGRDLGLAAAVLFGFSNLAFIWFTVVKTQVLSTLLLVAAYVVVARAGRTRTVDWVWGGVLLGLAIDVRLIVAAALPALLWAAHRDGRLARFGLGLGAGLLPSLVFFALDPGRFWFGNLGYHAYRSSGGLVGDFEQKAKTVLNLLGVGTPDGGVPQYLLLLVAGAMSAAVIWITARRVSLAFGIAVLVTAASLFPTPTYGQYLAVTVPFWIVVALELVAALRARVGSAEGARIARAALALAVGTYVLLGLYDLARYPRILGEVRLGEIERTGALVDARTRGGEQVLAPWPGYLYGSHAVPAKGMENDFAPHEADAVSAADAKRYRLASAADVERMLAEGRTRVVVFRLWNTFPPVPDWEGGLRRGGYRQVAQTGTTKIFVRG